MIGVLGGTFDPVHFGHLRVALEVKESLNLDGMRLVPCNSPPHRATPVASAELRLIMLQSAIVNEPGLVVDTRELQRSGPSYMVDTLHSLREELSGESFGLVLGMDAFAGLETWYQFRELPKLTHFIVVYRPGFKLQIPKGLRDLQAVQCIDTVQESDGIEAGCVLFHEVSQIDISSTKIRDIIKIGKNPRFLVPESVLEIIQERNLYQ